MAAANWKCGVCGDDREELNVHHTIYSLDCEPWEYPEGNLRCLCRTCHTLSHLPEAKIESFVRLRLVAAGSDKLWIESIGAEAIQKFEFERAEAQRKRGVGRPSPLLPPEEERGPIVAEWFAQTKGADYDLLAQRLGGVTRGTAWRIAQKHLLSTASLVPTMEVS